MYSATETKNQITLYPNHSEAYRHISPSIGVCWMTFEEAQATGKQVIVWEQ